jgi:hypoxanthine phosphoribosyltransferase
MNRLITDDIKEILIPEDKIMARVGELADMINKDYAGKNPVLISILKGSVIFMADLLRRLEIPCSIDFIAVSSYAGGTESSGIVRLMMDLRDSVEDRHVLLIEDIVDTGLTISYLRNNISTRNPRSFKVCTMLFKPDSFEQDEKLDYVGFEVPNKFVVGYGLDYNEQYRNLPYIGVLSPKIYRKKI